MSGTAHPVDAAFLAAYAAAIAFIGLRAAKARRPGGEDYILAGRALTAPTFVASLVTGFYGGVLGIGEFTYRYGISNWITQALPYYVFALLYAVFLAGRIRARPGLTIPDHLDSVYGRRVAVLAAVLVFVLASPADEVLMLGLLAHWTLGWPLALSVVGVMAVSVCFLFRGGLRAEVSTGRLELLFMFGGFALIVPFAWIAVKGASGLAASLPAAHLDWTGGAPPSRVLAWFFIALWTFVDPTFHQRVCAAKDARTARIGIAVSVCFWFVFDCMTTTAGLCARSLLPDLQEPLAAFPSLAERLLPPALRGLFLAGVASSTIAALGSTSFLSAVSLGKDGIGRLLDASEEDRESWVRIALGATCVLAVALALALPSVVKLWYLVGSVVIPGLLVVLISSYFETLHVSPRAAFLSSLAGVTASAAAWALGSETPFYPGLAASLTVWAAGKAAGRPQGRPGR
ncbi:MAG: sodium:solute symporter family protein [Elusimicrobia bacterium]|nr:sodium:solute symporter family protein [Elusimicrobiota bacterium]